MTTGAVIIAFNPSRHTDRFHPALRQGEVSLLADTVNAFLSNGVKAYVVTGARAEEVRQDLEGLDVVFVHHEAYDREDMLSAVKLGARAAMESCERIFVTPLSIPPVDKGDVARLMQSDAFAAMPVREGIGGHPVLLGAAAVEDLLRYDGEDGLRGWLRQQGNRVLRVDMEQSTAAFREKIQVRLMGGEAFFGPGPRQLLLGIQSRGSVSGACDAIGISYSKGRSMIRRMEKELGFPLVERKQGGANGGAASLTLKGQIFLEIYARYEKAVQDYAERIFDDYFAELEEIK